MEKVSRWECYPHESYADRKLPERMYRQVQIPPTHFPSEKKFTLKLFPVKNKNLISAVTGDKERERKGWLCGIFIISYIACSCLTVKRDFLVFEELKKDDNNCKKN